MYYMRETEPGLWTVGADSPKGWEPIGDFDDRQQAMNTVAYMNGGGQPRQSAPDSDMVYRTQSSQIATANAIDAARVAIDEQRYERAQALAAVAQAEALVSIEAHLATIASAADLQARSLAGVP